MADPLSQAAHVADAIGRVLAAHAGVFAREPRLADTLREIEARDRAFFQNGGVFFAAGKDAFETADNFTRVHLDNYRQTGHRPSLPALAVHQAQKMGFAPDSPEYHAMILVAVRAEMKGAVTPDYHSKFHYLDVAAMTATFLQHDQSGLTTQEKALAFIAAIGHDIDHEGRGNPADQPLCNELKSFAAMEPLLIKAGVAEQDIDQIYAIVMTTSPNGPHALLKAVAQAGREGRAADFAVLDPHSRFPQLQALAGSRSLTQMAAIVSDSDLYASSGAGMTSCLQMSQLLTAEMGKAGVSNDFTTDASRKFFLDNIVGKEGYASEAGRAVAGESLAALRAETERRLAAARTAPRPSAPKPPG